MFYGIACLLISELFFLFICKCTKNGGLERCSGGILLFALLLSLKRNNKK